jgi:hypothetical protein
MSAREEIPEDVMKMAMAAQDEAEAHCKEQKYVYGFGTGNAKMVLDHYIAKAILKARKEAYGSAANFLREHQTLIYGGTRDPAMPELIRAIESME